MKSVFFQKRTEETTVYIIALVLFLTFFPHCSLEAATCGGSIACQCGDTVAENYEMTADIGPCPHHGLRIASGVTLNGNGHRIYANPTAKRPKAGKIGLYSRSNKYAAFYEIQLTDPKKNIILLQDDFTETRSNDWQIIEGQWRVKHDAFIEVSDKNTHNIAVAGPAVEDFELKARLRSGDDDSLGIIFRFQDSQNFSVVELNAQKQYVRVRQRMDGTFVTLAHRSIPPYTKGEFFSVRIRVEQQHLQLTLRNQIVLDKKIKDQSGYGVYLRGTTESTVKNVVITGFQHGIRLRKAHHNRMIQNEVYRNGNFTTHSGYGIDVAKGSTDNHFEGNRIHHNADEGIHIGPGSHRPTLVKNEFYENFRENIYILRANRGIFRENISRGGGANSIYLKHGAFHRFEHNTFSDRPARIRGDAHDNHFIDNAFINTGVHFQAYQENDALTHPTRNLLSGGSISGAEFCLRFSDAFGNIIRGTHLSHCRTDISAEATQQGMENTLINISVNPDTLSVDDQSLLRLGRQVQVNVTDTLGAPIAGAIIKGFDSQNKLIFTAVSAKNGTLPPQDIITTIVHGSKQLAQAPHTLLAEFGSTSVSQDITLDDPIHITLALPGS